MQKFYSYLYTPVAFTWTGFNKGSDKKSQRGIRTFSGKKIAKNYYGDIDKSKNKIT